MRLATRWARDLVPFRFRLLVFINKSMSRIGTVAVLVIAAIVATTAAPIPPAANGLRPDKVVLLHRHGARTALGLTPDGGMSCADPLCRLTNAGKDMLFELGREIQAAYGGTVIPSAIVSTPPPPGAILVPSPYNTSVIPSISTSVDRVVVSAEAFILGMYEGFAQPPAVATAKLASVLPYVDYVAQSDDIQLSPWTAWPAWRLHHPCDVADATNVSELRAMFVVKNNGTSSSTDFIAEFGREFGITDVCSNSPWTCVSYVRDMVVCNVSAGLPVNPVAQAAAPILESAAAWYMSLILGYDPVRNDYEQQVGSRGYPWANGVLSKLAFPSNEAPASLARLYHYAAHDWTIFAVLTALGVWTPRDSLNASFAIRFAEAVVLELYAGGTVGDVSSNTVSTSRMRNTGGLLTAGTDDALSQAEGTYVRCLRGIPNQTYESGYSYQWFECNMTCQQQPALGGRQYRSSNCSLADLWRFVNATAANSSMGGPCYATADDLSASNCDSVDAPPVASPCAFYRSKCPAFACPNPENQLADPASQFACVDLIVPAPATMETWASIAVALPSALVGMVIGYFASARFSGWCRKKEDTANRLPDGVIQQR